jgi:hypothetical protein
VTAPTSKQARLRAVATSLLLVLAPSICGGAAATPGFRTTVPAELPRSLDASPQTAVPGIAGHLYTSYLGALRRYPMRDGVPGQQPDLSFHRVDAPVAVDHRGNVYAATRGGVAVYPPGSNKAERSIVLTQGYNPGAVSLTIDASGYLYVLTGIGSDPSRQKAASPQTCGAPDIEVFRPDARGRATPVLCFPDLNFGNMTTNALDDLFYSCLGACGGDSVAIIDRVHRGGTVDSLTSADIQYPSGITTGAGELYVENYGNNGGRSSFISVFPATARGNVRASRRIKSRGARYWFGQLAVDSRYLYVMAGPDLIVFDKSSVGVVAPVAETKFAMGTTLAAVGP